MPGAIGPHVSVHRCAIKHSTATVTMSVSQAKTLANARASLGTFARLTIERAGASRPHPDLVYIGVRGKRRVEGKEEKNSLGSAHQSVSSPEKRRGERREKKRVKPGPDGRVNLVKEGRGIESALSMISFSFDLSSSPPSLACPSILAVPPLRQGTSIRSLHMALFLSIFSHSRSNVLATGMPHSPQRNTYVQE